MKLLKDVFEFYLNSSIHVALAVTSLSYITYYEFSLEVNFNLLLFNFFATVTAYNFVKYFGLARFHHRSLAKWLRVIQVFSGICFLALLYFSRTLRTETLLFLAAMGLVTFLYAVPFLPRSYLLDSEKNLRSISGIKIYVIALVWSVVTVIIPLMNEQVAIDLNAIILALQRFLLVLVWILPFEIRDLKYDSIKLSTIPQRIGVKATKLVGVALLMICLALEFFLVFETRISITIPTIISMITAGFLIFAKTEQGRYYSSFWVEGIPIYWLLLTMVV